MTAERRRWKILTLMALAILLVMTTWFSATAVVWQLTTHLGLGDTGRVWLTISVQIGFVAGALCSAAFGWADRFSGRALIVTGSLAVAGVNLLILWLDHAGPVILARCLTGFFLAIVYPPAMKLTSTWFLTRRGVALGVLIAAITVGSATPHLVNALGGLAWEVVIVWTSIFALAGGIVVACFITEGPHPYPNQPFEPKAAARAFGIPAVRWVTIGYLGHMWELYAMWAWFAVFYQFVLDQAAIANSGVLAGITSDRYGRSATAYWALVGSGLMAAIIGFLSGSPALVFTLALVWGITIVADSAQFSALLTEVAPREYVGSVLTLQVAMGYLLTVPIIWLVPGMAGRFGWGAAFLLLSAGSLAGAYAMRRTRALMKTPAETAPTA